MLKIKKIKLNGFRGILHEKELDCSSASSQTNSLVLYGPNSTGKTSFVDGMEWFLSPRNQIKWLKREKAKEAAYPHHEATESFVEIHFQKDGSTKVLRKTFNHARKTVPKHSSEEDFKEIYSSFIIKPYLRYQEIVEFVLNSTGVEKYKKLAEWMGFEYELSFQKKLAEIIPRLDDEIKNIEIKIEEIEGEMFILSENSIILVNNVNIAQYANKLFLECEKIKHLKASSSEELKNRLPELEKLQIQSELSKKLSILSGAEAHILTKSFSDNLLADIATLKKEIVAFKESGDVAKNVDVLSLYSQAQNLLARDDENNVLCPICHTEWKKNELLAHIKTELSALEVINKKRDELSEKIEKIKIRINTDLTIAISVLLKVDEIEKIIPMVSILKITEYQKVIDKIYKKFNPEKILDCTDIHIPSAVLSTEITEEKIKIIETIQKNIKELKPTEEEEKLTKNIEKLKKLSELWGKLGDFTKKKDFYKIEIDKFKGICEELNKKIKEDIQSRFNEVSELICTYFSKLRTDKKIRDIQISYNISGRADSRSAEIQLFYYDIEVRPAYKILSESLLNSLGLSVYFACLKKFNSDTKFIVLDDVINSLDSHHRLTLIDILADEFSDYQIIIFTHDRLWFDQIRSRFPDWIKKKIIDWTYDTGPQIGIALSTKEELEETLKDDAKAETAGRDFGEHVEGRLNELAENLEAKLKHRYKNQDPPALRELFDSINARLKKLKIKKAISENHSIMKSIGKASNDDPFIRNICSHDRRHYEGFITAIEVKKIINQWYADIEPLIICSKCNRMITFNRDANKVVCPKGCLDLSRDIINKHNKKLKYKKKNYE